ncbi:hypothetical protein KKF82_08155 [Patescibacteria group bacterium]|nr:hypothetical protein [Patescibacteria group bacterium]
MPGIFKGYQDYSEFVHEMEQDGWEREQIAVDNTNANLAATVNQLVAGATGNVITITCPPGRVMSMMGAQQVPAGADRGTAHSFWMRLTSAGTEINELTHINIQKSTPSTAIVPLIKDIYQSVCLVAQRQAAAPLAGTVTSGNLYKSDDQIHRFRKGIVLYGQEQLQIQIVNTVAIPSNIITAANTQFSIDLDLWTKVV